MSTTPGTTPGGKKRGRKPKNAQTPVQTQQTFASQQSFDSNEAEYVEEFMEDSGEDIVINDPPKRGRKKRVHSDDEALNDSDRSDDLDMVEEPRSKYKKRKGGPRGPYGEPKNKRDGVFHGLYFTLSGTLTLKRADFEKLIESYGGNILASVSRRVSYMVTSPEDAAILTAKVRRAQELQVTVVSEQFIHDSISAQHLPDPEPYKLNLAAVGHSSSKMRGRPPRSKSSYQPQQTYMDTFDIHDSVSEDNNNSNSSYVDYDDNDSVEMEPPVPQRPQTPQSNTSAARGSDFVFTQYVPPTPISTPNTSSSITAQNFSYGLTTPSSIGGQWDKIPTKKVPVTISHIDELSPQQRMALMFVDEKSPYTGKGHLSCHEQDIFSVYLSHFQPKMGLIQLIKLDNKNKWVLWVRLWETSAPDDGQITDEHYKDFESAKRAFMEKFLDLTSNSWDSRLDFKNFRNKYSVDSDELKNTLLDDDVRAQLDEIIPVSELPVSVQRLVDALSGPSAFNTARSSYALDSAAVSLDNFSVTKQDIWDARDILLKIDQVLHSKSILSPGTGSITTSDTTTFTHTSISNLKKEVLRQLSKDYFRKIPHNNQDRFKDKKSQSTFFSFPMITSVHTLNYEMKVLEALSYLYKANTWIKNSSLGQFERNPLDFIYSKWELEFTLLDKNTQEYTIINQYAQSTHNKKYSNYTLEVTDVFSVQQIEAEEDTAEEAKTKQKSNHGTSGIKRLLWFGAPNIFVLSQLKGMFSKNAHSSDEVASASKTDSTQAASNNTSSTEPTNAKNPFVKNHSEIKNIFGKKGVVFSDSITCCADRCEPSPQSQTGVLILAEVDIKNSDNTKIVNGRFQPSSYPTVKLHEGCSCEIPSGDLREISQDILLTKSAKNGSKPDSIPQSMVNMYNQYTIFTTDQINIKYIVQVKFDWPQKEQ